MSGSPHTKPTPHCGALPTFAPLPFRLSWNLSPLCDPALVLGWSADPSEGFCLGLICLFPILLQHLLISTVYAVASVHI